LKLFRFAPFGLGYEFFGVDGLDHARAPAPRGGDRFKRFSVAIQLNASTTIGERGGE
jgi:hypothetical protein